MVKAQLQEQKFLQRMLEDRGESVKGIEATAAELVKAASPEDREQVQTAIPSPSNLHVYPPALYKKLKKNEISYS